jgi:hypothetical protein
MGLPLVSASIVFICDVTSEHGICPQKLYAGTPDLAAARQVAEQAGWQLSAAADRCARYHAPRPIATPRRRVITRRIP